MFEIGEVVQLKSGGPPMTVTQVSKDGEDVTRCIWFAGTKTTEQAFKSVLLMKVEPEPARVVKVDL